MSRSYKKTPRAGDRKSPRSGVSMKTVFNRAIRREPITEHSSAPHSKRLYRKKHQSWDICDYQTVAMPFQEYWKQALRVYNEYRMRGWNVSPPDKKQEYRNWYKAYKAK